MSKLLLTLASALASLSLAGYWPDEPEAPPAPPAPPEDVVKSVEVRVVSEGEDEPEQALQDAYLRLTRLRGERPAPEARSREMIERASELYRRAVRAYGAEDDGRQAEARSLAIASRELARAVERLRDVERGDRRDPELPPPPAGPRGARVKVQASPRGPLRKIEAVPPPPPIPPELPAGVAEGRPPVPPVPPAPPRMARIFVGPEGKAEAKSFVFVTPEGDVLRDAEGKAQRKFEVRVDEGRIKALEGELRARADEVAARARDRATKADGKAARARAQLFELRSRGGPGQAHQELQRAYDRIRKAREESKGDDAKFYLDAARDLYNAARRDAEAGRFDRAAELARAAEALTHVPAHLGAIKGDGHHLEERPVREREVRKEVRRFEVRVPREGDRTGEAKEGKAEEPAKEGEDGPPRREEERKRIEIRRVRPEPEADARVEAEESAGDKVSGIGVAIGEVDDELVVLQVVPGGPAGRDGRLKKDDVLVGVAGDDGEKLEFAGKDLPEIVRALRGPAGTKVRLLVRPAGEDEVEVIELERGEVTVPSRAESGRNEIDRAVQEAFKHLQGPGEPARPAGAGGERLPPPLPE